MRLLFIVLVSLLATSAFAEEPRGCDKFRWPIERDQALLTSSDLPSIKSGMQINGEIPKAATLQLLPWSTAQLPVSPERTPKVLKSFVGYLELSNLPPGQYQITLSEAAWVDFVQDHLYLKPTAFSGVLECAGVRKSIRFNLERPSLVLQFSDVPVDHMSIVVRHVDD